MAQSKIKEKVGGHWSKEMLPVFLVFSFSVIFSIYLSDHSTSESWKVVYRNFLRFFRYTLFLCLPLYLLRPIYRFILEKGKGALIQLGHPSGITIHPLKHWLFRPFQGIGIGQFQGIIIDLPKLVMQVRFPSPNRTRAGLHGSAASRSVSLVRVEVV